MTKICNLDDVEENNSIGLPFEINGNTKMLMIVRMNGEVYAYVNSCPHIGAPLDMRPGKFLTNDNKFIMCSTHGALFEIDTGHCTFGPCKDDHLEAVPVFIKDNNIFYGAK